MSVRATRLLAILESLQGRRQPMSAKELSERHEVSVRTIYRDIASLRTQGATIEGEPGIGYVLTPGFILPPLSFSEEELEAFTLGIRWVAAQGDPELAAAAQRSLQRIVHTLPPKLRICVDTCGLLVPKLNPAEPAAWLASLRSAIRDEEAIQISYRDGNDSETQRRVWPFLLVFFKEVKLLAAWCELRQDFRSFRADRILSLRCCGQRYPQRRHTLIKRWRIHLEQEEKNNADKSCQEVRVSLES